MSLTFTTKVVIMPLSFRTKVQPNVPEKRLCYQWDNSYNLKPSFARQKVFPAKKYWFCKLYSLQCISFCLGAFSIASALSQCLSWVYKIARLQDDTYYNWQWNFSNHDLILYCMIAWIGQGNWAIAYAKIAWTLNPTYFSDAGGLRRRYALLGEDGQELLRAGQT